MDEDEDEYEYEYESPASYGLRVVCCRLLLVTGYWYPATGGLIAISTRCWILDS